MQFVFWMSVCGLLFVLGSVASVYSYGRFARRARGVMSQAFAVIEDATELDRAAGHLTVRHPGETGMVLLRDNLHAFAARALTVRAAGRSLDLQYYYWKDDLTGGLLAREVIAAADRGVRVRLLLDDISIRSDNKSYRDLDNHENIEVRLFNPSQNRTSAMRRGFEMLFRALSITRRMHNKAWIVDGRVAIVGGRNIGDAYFDASVIANFHDMDLLLLGACVHQTETVFDSFWNSSVVIPLCALASAHKGKTPRLRTRLERLATHRRAVPYLRRVVQERDARSLLSTAMHWSRDAHVVSDPPEKALGQGEDHWLRTVINPVLASSKSRLEIISPYFIPGEEGVRQLSDLTGRGVSVSVLTNSLAATDVAAVHGAYAHYRKQLLARGVALFELKPDAVRPDAARQGMSLFGSSGASLHTKAFTVDGETGFIGSFNFDARSASLNTEMGVFFTDRALVNEVREGFASQIASNASYRVLLRQDALVWEDGAGTDQKTWRREPKATVWRRLGSALTGFLPIESQL